MFGSFYSSITSSTTAKGFNRKDAVAFESCLLEFMESRLPDSSELRRSRHTSTTYDFDMFSERVDARFEETSVV
jgi:hypothetical protein